MAQVPAQAVVAEFLKSFKDFPPRQEPASFSIDQALEKARQTEKQMAVASGGGAKQNRRVRSRRPPRISSQS